MRTIHFEEGGEKLVELIMKLTVWVEEKPVNVLCQTFATLKSIPVKWDAAHDHVTLRNFLHREAKSFLLCKLKAFLQGERTERQAKRDAVVKSAMVFENLADNP